MAGVDLNRNPAPVETKERRPAPVKRERAGARAGDRQREGTGAIAGTPKRTNALWFFVALLGGGAGVWWTKSAFSNAWIAATVAAGVVLALIAYYMLNDEDAPEEEGDNVYYLGLLFTLISLMFTLVELFGSDTDAVRNVEKIRVLLENFGIALTSTIAGIAGRVAVQNWQRTGIAGRPEFAEDTAVPTLPPAGATSRDLERFNRLVFERIARDLIRGVNALARFHRMVRSHASDTESYLRSHSETLIRESAAFKDTLQRNAETFARELKSEAKNTLDAVGGSLDAAAKQAEGLPERLRSAHDAYLSEVREVTRSFHDDLRSASSQSLDALRQNFDAAARQAEALPERRGKLKPCRSGSKPLTTGTSLKSARPLGHFMTTSNLRAVRASTPCDRTLMQRRSSPSRWRKTCLPSTSGLARRSTALDPASGTRATRARRSATAPTKRRNRPRFWKGRSTSCVLHSRRFTPAPRR